MVNKVRTGKTYHAYINPQRDISEESVRIHGISNEFVKDKPIFSKIAKEFLDFIKGASLVIHNAGFDVSFLNYELAGLGYPEISLTRVIDTLTLARRKFPGAPASLDALCRRFNINLSSRDKHGALIDAELLADVYIELSGGTQSNLDFSSPDSLSASIEARLMREKREPRVFNLSDEEKADHELFLKKIANPMWKIEYN